MRHLFLCILVKLKVLMTQHVNAQLNKITIKLYFKYSILLIWSLLIINNNNNIT